MNTKYLALVASLLALSCFAFVSPARAEGSQPAPTIATSEAGADLPRGTSLGSRADAQRYASREVASPEAKQYRGGDVIVISATAVAIILLVIVILILL